MKRAPPRRRSRDDRRTATAAASGAARTPCHLRYSGFIAERDTPRIATSGALMIGVNAVPPMPPRLETVKQPPCISAPDSLPARAFSESSAERARDVVDVLAVGVADHRHQQAVRRVGREADVAVALVDEVLAALVERGVEQRELGSVRTQARRMKASGVSLTPRSPRLSLSFARFLEAGDVGFVELRDVRQVDPGSRAGAGPRSSGCGRAA
jgi:hypothetical protein